MSVVDTLKKNPIFSKLREDEIKDIAGRFQELSFKKDDSIFWEGDPSDWLYIVSEGQVKIVRHTGSGKDVIIEVVPPGEIFGGVAVLDKKPYPASALSMGRTEVIRLQRKSFLLLLDEYPGIAIESIKHFGERLRDAHDMLRSIAVERVEKRIATLLLKLSEKAGIDEGGYRKIDIYLTRQDIAEMVGTTVETAIRTMSRFTKDGIIRTADGKIVIIDGRALREIVDEG